MFAPVRIYIGFTCQVNHHIYILFNAFKAIYFT